MTSLIARDKTEAKKKGYVALGAWGGSALLLFGLGWTVPGVGAAVGASYLTYKWFMYRAKRGMRF
jgi:hypothetical protein